MDKRKPLFFYEQLMQKTYLNFKSPQKSNFYKHKNFSFNKEND